MSSNPTSCSPNPPTLPPNPPTVSPNLPSAGLVKSANFVPKSVKLVLKSAKCVFAQTCHLRWGFSRSPLKRSTGCSSPSSASNSASCGLTVVSHHVIPAQPLIFSGFLLLNKACHCYSGPPCVSYSALSLFVPLKRNRKEKPTSESPGKQSSKSLSKSTGLVQIHKTRSNSQDPFRSTGLVQIHRLVQVHRLRRIHVTRLTGDLP